MTEYPKPGRGRVVIYVSGPMTGIPRYNFPAFDEAAEALLDAGWLLSNPAERGIIPNWGWEDYLRWDIRDLLDCDSIYMLDGWSQSKGAQLEHHIAKSLGMNIYGAGV